MAVIHLYAMAQTLTGKLDMMSDQSKPGTRSSLRIALIFPPAMHPTSPPLGIASLKAYLLSKTAAEAKNFDLNLAYREQALAWMQDGRLNMSLRKMGHGETARQVSACRDLFRGREGPESFLSLDRYNESAALYSGFGTVLDGLFENFCRKIILDVPVPPLVQEFFQELVQPVVSFRADLVGFSVLFSQQLFFALALAKYCRRAGARTVFGGATFSVMPNPEKLLSGPVAVRLGKETHPLNMRSLIDYLIVGEGEAGLLRLVQRAAGRAGISAGGNAVDSSHVGQAFQPANLRQARNPAPHGSSQRVEPTALPWGGRIPGLVPSGCLMQTPPEPVMNLDLLPIPDFSDFPLDRYYSPSPVLPYLSSRGCPWRRCAFCTHQKTYLDYREQDPGVAARNLSSLKRAYGVTFFSLVDEMIQPKRLDRLCGHLEAEDNAIIFSAYAKPSKGFHPDFLRRAHRCGLRVMMWGVESGSQRVLDLMRKGTRVEEVGKVLKDASEAKIWNLVFAIFGFPTETQTEWQATLDFLEANRDRIDALSKSRFLLVEGSDIFQHPGRYGITAVKDRPQRDPVSIAYDYEVAVGMSQHEIQNKFRDSLPVLSGTGRSPWFGQFRDHMLIFAAVASGQAVSPRSG